MNTPQVSKLKSVGLACLLAGVAIAASANDRDQAKRIHDRIAGVPPSEATLDQMEAMVTGGNPTGAALIATQAPMRKSSTGCAACRENEQEGALECRDGSEGESRK